MDDTGTAPPTEQGEFVPWQPPATWPVAIGVISIVLGSLGALVYIWSAIAPFVMGAFASYASANDPSMKATFQVQRDMAGWTVPAAVLCTLAALLLLVTGIGFTSRCPWAVRSARMWAILKVFVGAFSAVSTYLVQQAVYNAVSKQSSPTSPAATMAGMGHVMSIATGAFSLAWAWAFPIFMLVWLSRPKVRTEIARWKP